MGDAAYLPGKGTIYDLLKLGAYFGSSSVMYRKQYEFSHSANVDIVDYFFHIERASKGNIFLDRKVFGEYRIHDQGISKNSIFRKTTERCYEAAFDRAMELGVERKIVQSARMNRRMAFAIAQYLSGDVVGYKDRIKINRNEFGLASKKHLILHWTRGFPILVGIYGRLRGLT